MNIYDDRRFFEKYSQMSRSRLGLEGAGEWRTLERMLPDFSGKRVLDLGCGFGWHCVYAARHGAVRVLGLDRSENMLRRAREQTRETAVEYRQMELEEYEYPEGAFDVVLSSLALHYVKDFSDVCQKAARTGAGTSSFLSSTPSLRPMGSRSGCTARRGRFSAGRWTGILRRGSGTPSFWGSG